MTEGLEEELYKAVSNADVALIKHLLGLGAKVNTLVRSGQTILGKAVQLGQLETIETLLHAEDYLPPEDQSPSQIVAETNAALESYLDNPTGLFNWSSPEQSFSESISPGTSMVESLSTSRTEGKSPESSLSSDGWREPPQPSRRGLSLFQSLRKFTSHQRKCDVNIPDFYDRVPIHYAAERGEPEILRLLLKAECRVNVSDSENITPLHLSVSRGHEEVTEMLLKAGSRVNSKTSDKSSALHIAASRGYAGICEKLLNHGAKIDILDASDRTPLLLAVSRGHRDVVKLLLQRGAKVNVEEIHGYTPLAEAVWRNDCVLVQMLLDAGAKVIGLHHLVHYAILHHSVEMTHLLLRAGAVVNVRDDNGDTPLHIAVRSAQLEIVQTLLNYGASVNLCSGLSGQTLLHEAVIGNQENDSATFRKIVQLLLNKGCRLNVESFTPGDTPLYKAIVLEKFTFAEELIRQGSDVNMGNVYSCNIDNLCLAKRKNHFRTVKLLVYAGFRLWRTPWLEILPSPLPHSYTPCSIKGWLIYMKCNPLNLTDLCRISVRRALGENLVLKISRLHIPERLKQFLLLYDVPDDKDNTAAEAAVADVSNANLAITR